ncbi:MAG: response regulator [Hormoscilla sp.]
MNLEQINESGNILIVDDTPANLKVLMGLLSKKGYTVRPIPSGKLAIQGIHLDYPDIILLDINMPDMNGYEVCKHLKADARTQDIPVIFVSALDEVFDKIKAFEVGGIDYITKPFQAEEVLVRVKSHMLLARLQKGLQEKTELQDLKLEEKNVQLQQMNQQLEKANQELQARLHELQQAQLQLVQNEKMATLGQLVAGIAHEINNPVGFLQGNIRPAQEYVQDVLGLLALYQAKFPNPGEEIEERIEAIELEYLREDLPESIDSMTLGVERIKNISTSLRTFSRSDKKHKVSFHLPDGIESTLLILKHRLKANKNRPAIEVGTEYGEVPPIECFPGQLNQVFMNLLANAIDALEEGNSGRSFADLAANPNRITIKTAQEGDRVVVRIADNGTGMPLEVKQRIFDQGFTTKPVGKGTGLGMAIARQIVVEKHGGSITCNSELGKGTEFAIALPLT